MRQAYRLSSTVSELLDGRFCSTTKCAGWPFGSVALAVSCQVWLIAVLVSCTVAGVAPVGAGWVVVGAIVC